MSNQTFYIKYLYNQPVKVESHTDTRKARREYPLTDVSDLVVAFQSRPGSLLANTDSGLITLHLPDGVSRSDSRLDKEYFDNVDETDETVTTLDPGCPLSSLGSLGSKSKQPLVIKSKELGIGIYY